MRATQQLKTLGVIATILISVAACGGSDGDDSTDSDAASGDAAESDNASSDETSSDETSTDGDASDGDATNGDTTDGDAAPIDPASFEWPTTPIDPAAVFVGTDATGDCPYVSVETVDAGIADVWTEDAPLRGAATNNGCEFWSFSNLNPVVIEVEPVAEADDPTTLQYDRQIPGVQVPMDGPGENAMMLMNGDAEDAFSFGYYFETDGYAVTLTHVGLFVEDESWRSIADEIAASIANGAADGSGEGPSLDQRCAIYTPEEMQVIIGADAPVPEVGDTASPSCDWLTDEVTVGITYSDDPARFDYGQPTIDVSDQVGMSAVSLEPVSDLDPAIVVVTLDNGAVVGVSTGSEEVAIEIARNLAERIQV